MIAQIYYNKNKKSYVLTIKNRYVYQNVICKTKQELFLFLENNYINKIEFKEKLNENI